MLSSHPHLLYQHIWTQMVFCNYSPSKISMASIATTNNWKYLQGPPPRVHDPNIATVRTFQAVRNIKPSASIFLQYYANSNWELSLNSQQLMSMQIPNANLIFYPLEFTISRELNYSPSYAHVLSVSNRCFFLILCTAFPCRSTTRPEL